MKAIYRKKIVGYSALSRFLSDVSKDFQEVNRKDVEGLPMDEYFYSQTCTIEKNPKMRFVRVETGQRTFSIYEIV
jgi:hypothetical protein